MKKALKYSDVCLLPNYSEVSSRSECDTSVQFGPYNFALPVIPANMKTVIDESLAERLILEKYFYVLHRFGCDTVGFAKRLSGPQRGIKYVSVSVGVHDNDTIKQLSTEDTKVDYITVDVAHGHSLKVRKTIDNIRDTWGDKVFIIAGNVCTPSAVEQLSDWGADSVKVGIGQGSPCTTKDKTGFTLPMFTCVQECAKSGVPIIADGSVKCTGDITKALVAGAKMVMVGGMFARCADSPAETIMTDRGKQKIYYGSASAENKGHTKNIEGIKKSLGMDDMTFIDKFAEIKQDLQSSISYAGGNDLSVLSLENVVYREIN
jgi:GMP reductase